MTKTIVVTGATAGIGQQTAISLARQGACVVVTGRDATRGSAGVEAIRRESGSTDVHLVLGDLTRRADILRLATDLQRQFPRVDVLINNAGAFANAFEKTSDGLELCFAVNVAAPYLLTKSLLPALTAARPARVINVTGGRPNSPLDADNLQAEKGFQGLSTYDHSKRAADAMSLALARELAPLGVSLNVVYPGQASTRMTKSVRAEHLPWWMRPFAPLFAFMVRDDGGRGAAKASRSSVWAATASELNGVSGAYFDSNCRRARLSPTVEDEANQRRVLQTIDRAWGSLATDAR
jgi:NAD(P)-dependent dehydrogenase (short-subunit alcohol dehydrogenase family)